MRGEHKMRSEKSHRHRFRVDRRKRGCCQRVHAEANGALNRGGPEDKQRCQEVGYEPRADGLKRSESLWPTSLVAE